MNDLGSTLFVLTSVVEFAMRLAIMQPYFLPYLGYFSLIAATDHFIVFDPVQYIRHGWINRNRILKPGGSEAQYITLPLAEHSRSTLIRDIRLAANHDWRKRILAQVQHYRKRAPYFQQTREILERCFKIDIGRIVDLNTHCLATICEALEIKFSWTYFEQVADRIDPPAAPGEWSLNISAAMGAETYINLPGGRAIFDETKFREKGIELRFLQNQLTPYDQRITSPFIPALSIIDVLMFNSLSATRALIDDYEFLEAGLVT